MGTRLNMYCNGQIAGNETLRKNWDNMDWGPGHVQRDEFGFIIKKEIKNTGEANKDGHLQERLNN